ncbi:hypothetical protein V6N13_148149 [Hibiscus sabdariffa]
MEIILNLIIVGHQNLLSEREFLNVGMYMLDLHGMNWLMLISLDSWQQDRRRKSIGRIQQLQGAVDEMMVGPLSNDSLENLSTVEVELKSLVDKDEAYWSQ